MSETKTIPFNTMITPTGEKAYRDYKFKLTFVDDKIVRIEFYIAVLDCWGVSKNPYLYEKMKKAWEKANVSK